ncbi:MAG: hypothetical protein EKK55_08500, partial [Rhodocyclaceae bacterium]
MYLQDNNIPQKTQHPFPNAGEPYKYFVKEDNPTFPHDLETSYKIAKEGINEIANNPNDLLYDKAANDVLYVFATGDFPDQIDVEDVFKNVRNVRRPKFIQKASPLIWESIKKRFEESYTNSANSNRDKKIIGILGVLFHKTGAIQKSKPYFKYDNVSLPQIVEKINSGSKESIIFTPLFDAPVA